MDKKLKKQIEEMVTNEDIVVKVERQSFCRISDDLCEEVLKWLPFEDKIKLKSISNQFKTSLKQVLKRETVLIVDSDSEDIRNCKKLWTEKPMDSSDNFEVDINLMTNVFKTMPFIEELLFSGFRTIINGNEVLTTITDNCNHLKRIAVPFENIGSEEVMQRFAQKFGQSLTSIKWLSDNPFEALSYLELFTSLVSLKINDTNLDQILIDIPYNCDEYITLVSKLAKLEKLSIFSTIESEEDFKLYSDSMKSVAIHCKRMKRFVIKFTETDYEYELNTNQVLKWFQNFSTLRKLKIESHDYRSVGYELDISCLKSCHQLTRLSLVSLIITDRTFDGIETIVPQLKSLNITSTVEMTDEALVSISKLKNLNSIQLTAKNSNLMSDYGIISLIKSCLQLKDMRIWSKISITSVSLHRIISKAEMNPKIDFNYSLRPNDRDVAIASMQAMADDAIDAKSLPNITINLDLF